MKSTVTIRRAALILGALAAVPALFAATASPADQAFVAQVSQGGAYEVQAGLIAEQRATTPHVKDIATTEVHDHEGVNARLKKIADATGVTIDPQLKPEFQQRLDKLRKVPAANFDATYVADQMAIHDKDEKLFAKEAEDGSQAYRQFAHETDLIVKRHIGALKS